MRRLSILEQAMLGNLELGRPGIIELQRRQAEDLQSLRKSLDKLSQNVSDMVRARADEVNIRKGEQQMLKTFRNVAYALLIILGGGGTILGSRIIAILNGLR